MNEISTRDVRRLFLSSQGLLRNGQFGRGKNAALRAIEQLGYVQIDTISVLDRAHHHVLKTRVPNYQESMLDRLQAVDRRVFEFWAHAAAYLPMSAYRYSLPMMRGFARRPRQHKKLAAEILARIRAEGPLQSRDFENPNPGKFSGWWDWKPAKQVLETLFLSGELMVTRRDGFQKVFDLPERVLPADIDTTLPSADEWYRFLARNMVNALGAGTAMDVAYARTTIRQFTGRLPTSDIARALDELAEAGEFVKLDCAGDTVYASAGALARLPIRLGKRQLWFLSPFDNLVINRKRTQRLFDFDYQIECYVPEKKRLYGYYCLPILWGDALIGRLDAKASRNSGHLEVRLLQLESHVKIDDALLQALAESLTRLATAHGCNTVDILKSAPRGIREAVFGRLG